MAVLIILQLLSSFPIASDSLGYLRKLGMITDIIMPFEGTGRYVWHCHILEQDDAALRRASVGRQWKIVGCLAAIRNGGVVLVARGDARHCRTQIPTPSNEEKAR